MQRMLGLLLVLSAGGVVSTLAAGPTFRPDVVFSGSALTGWSPMGAADWRAQNGEIVGTPKSPGGGFLVLNRSYQDVALFTNLTCTGGCKAGVLLRAEKTANGGLKGVFVSLTEGDIENAALTIDSQGKIVSREPLPAPPPPAVGARGGGGGGGRGGAAAPGGGGGVGRGAPAGGRQGGGGRGAAPGLPPGVDLPGLERPTGEYRSGQTNSVDITLYDTGVNVRLNGGRLGGGGGGGAALPEVANYGAIALYVGGTAPASFRNLAYADLNARPFEDEKTSSNFRVRRLSEFYYSYASAIADVNRDGSPDVIAGPYIYYGPTFEVGRYFYTPQSFNPTAEYPQPAMVQLAHDWTGDGWPDILNMSGNAGNGTGTLFVNPKGEHRRWDRHVVMQPPDGVVGNEETLLKDIDHDGQLELIHTGQNTMRYSKPDPANPTGPWRVTTISEPGPWGVNISHGMGVGDIDGDGLNDYVSAYGWWKQPPKGQTGLWQYHPVEFARWGASQGGAGGAEIGVYDVNGDKLNDVVTALEGHGFGLAWHEQKRDAQGRITFVRHVIMDSYFDKNAGGVWFTQPHATTFADIDQDGILDLLVGKRHHSHFNYTDPDNWGMPVLYVYKARRNKAAPGGAEFVPELIHNRSGVGSHFATGDLNKDGTIDIATSGPSGTFVFFNLTKKGSK
jgi:hypothetical protein